MKALGPLTSDSKPYEKTKTKLEIPMGVKNHEVFRVAQLTAPKNNPDVWVLTGLALCTCLFALTQPVNPWPMDLWYLTKHTLFGHFACTDSYSPVAMPAVQYKLTDWLCGIIKLDTRSNMYIDSLVQNGLIFISSSFTYKVCRFYGGVTLSAACAVMYLLMVLVTGLPQAFWSENISVFLFSILLFLAVTLHNDPAEQGPPYWKRIGVSGLLTAALVVTRMIPVLMIPAFILLLAGTMNPWRLAKTILLISAIVGGSMALFMTSNLLRFDRFEVSNSSGRHLWQGVKMISDDLLGDDPAYQLLKHENNGVLEGVEHWDLIVPVSILPEESTVLFGLEECNSEFQAVMVKEYMLKKLVKRGILSRPVLYLKEGWRKFHLTIFRFPTRNGFYDRDTHPDPLHTDVMLPAISEYVPVGWRIGRGLRNLWRAMYRVNAQIYPLLVFFVLFSSFHIMIGGFMHFRASCLSENAMWSGVLFILSGLLVWITPPLQTLFFPAILMSALLSLLSVVGPVHNRIPGGFRQVYLFSLFVFVGSTWLSWQVEVNEPRYAINYLPALTLLFCMAVRYWGRILMPKHFSPEAALKN